MELQFPKSGQLTLMERILQHCDVVSDGLISRKHISILLQNLHPKLIIDDEEVEKLIAQYDSNGGSGMLDFDSVTKIIFNFLMKQSVDSIELLKYGDYFSKKDSSHEWLSVDDFVIFNNI